MAEGTAPPAGAGRLDGKVAVVTGSAGGIGEAVVRRFVAEGARVVVADVQDERGRAVAGSLGPSALYVRTDVSDESSVAATVDAAVERFGRLDVMFNNAAVLGALGPLTSLSYDAYRFTMSVDLDGVFLGMKHAARVMEPQGSGVILSTASPGGMVGGLGPHPYAAAKAAVAGLTLSVAAELRPKGIRVNAIAPGAVATQMTAAFRTGDPDAVEETAAAFAQTSLMGRPATGDDIAAAAVFLASDEASYITAVVLRVDGGLIGAPGRSAYTEADQADGLLREGGRRDGAAT
ncbi:MAG: glucose 1-dehydrogenase [Acidimicrobiia bacterium]